MLFVEQQWPTYLLSVSCMKLYEVPTTM